MTIGKLGDSLPIARILNSEEDVHQESPQEITQTGIANAQNSFVDASKEKSRLSSASFEQSYGKVSGLEVAANTDSSVKVSPGSAVDHFGEAIQSDSGRNSYFDGKHLTAADFQREQEYKKHGNEWSGLKGGLSAVQMTIDAFRSNAVVEKLAAVTGISCEEIQSLFNKHALDAGNLPSPPNSNIFSFIQDPALASCTQQELLAALYSQ